MSLSYRALIDFFKKIESRYPVQQWTIDGVHCWPLLRIGMEGQYASKMIVEQNKLQDSSVHISRNGKFDSYFNLIYNNLFVELKLWQKDRKHRQILMPCDVVMSGNSMYRNVTLPSGEIMEHNLDPLYMMLSAEGYQVFMFEMIKEDSLHYPRWSRSFVTNNMFLLAKVKRKLMQEKVEIRIGLELFYKILCEYSYLGTDIGNWSLDMLIYQVQLIRLLANDFEEKLRVLSPQIVILDCWYSADKMALCMAAHKQGIPVVDVQHGIAGGGGVHPNYYNWSNMPVDGYEMMPDYMWAWSQEDYDAIMQWGGDQVVSILGGHPMNLVWDDPDCPDVQYYYNLYEKDFDSDQPTILFTLDPVINYPDWIADFINQASEYTWLIRLHPHVDENERAFLRKLEHKENIMWESVRDFPLEILLQKVDLHITAASSVVADAESADCCSILIHPYGRELYASRIASGAVYYADNSDLLLLTINDILSRRNTKKREDCMKTRYALGRAGVQKLIEIIESH